MQIALDSLRKNATNPHPLVQNTHFKIEATHYYLKFSPKNEEELDALKEDSTLTLYNYPLDYEIMQGNGYFYHDPKIPIDKPTYQYCAVSVKRPLPNRVTYEILDKLYMPVFPDDYSHTIKPKLTMEQFEELERISLIQTNNWDMLKELDESKQYNASVARWTPQGKIRVWDDKIGTITKTETLYRESVSYDYTLCYRGGYSNCPRKVVTRTPYYKTVTTNGSFVPVKGVKVRARRWIFFTGRGITDSNGNYTCDRRFSRPANYSIQWDRYHFSIRAGEFGQAVFNGPKQRGNWNLDIKGGKSEYHATIFRAAYHYYYKDIKGLKRPPLNSTSKPQMKIAARDYTNEESNGRHNKDVRIFGILSRIRIYSPHRSSEEIYATTIHELAHASHWELRKNNWNFGNTHTKVKESWARGVEWELTRMIYPSSEYKGREFSRGFYTLVVADMIDGPATNSTIINDGYIDANDQVSGYTIKQIEDVLNNTSSWNGWRDNIISTYNNPTKHHLTTLFKAYE